MTTLSERLRLAGREPVGAPVSHPPSTPVAAPPPPKERVPVQAGPTGARRTRRIRYGVGRLGQ